MNYPKVDLQVEVRSIEGGYEVTVSADKFARAVCLSVADNESVYSDKLFLMSAEEQRAGTGQDAIVCRSVQRFVEADLPEQ